MAETIDKYSVQLSANATALQKDMAKAGADVEKQVGKTNAKLGDSAKKGFELKADTLSKIGIMASGGQILDKLIAGNEAIQDMVDATKTIALGWAVGGVIGAGVGALTVGVMKVGDAWDKVWEKANKGQSLNLADQIAGGLQIIGGADPGRKMFQAAEGERKTRADAARETADQLRAAMEAKVLQADPETMLNEADAFAKMATEAHNGAENINELRADLSRLYGEAKAADFVTKTNESIKALERQADTFGLTADQIAKYDAKIAGAKASQVDFGRIADAQLRLESSQIKGADPLKQFETRKNRLQEMFRAGYLNAKQFNAALLDAGKLLDSLSDKAGPNVGLQANTTAGMLAANQARREQTGGNKNEASAALLKAQQEGNQIAAEMAAKLETLRQVMGNQVVDIMGL